MFCSQTTSLVFFFLGFRAANLVERALDIRYIFDEDLDMVAMALIWSRLWIDQ
jgi:hypothetical protein